MRGSGVPCGPSLSARCLARRRRVPTDQDDAGFVLVTVVLLSVVLMALAMTAFAVTGFNITGASETLEEVQATASVEAGISAAYHAIASAPNASYLPCKLGGRLPTGSGGATGTYSVQIAYFSTTGDPPPTASALSCSTVQGGAVVPIEANITVTGTGLFGQSSATQSAESLVSVVAEATGYAIFSASGLSLSNGVSVSTPGNEAATIYVGGSASCPNSVDVMASMVALGSVSMSNACTISGWVWSAGSLTMSNVAQIDGNAVVSGAGNGINMTNHSSIKGNALATGPIQVISPAAISGSQVDDSSDVPSPPSIPLPGLSLDAAGWQAAGYVVEPPNDDCNPASSDPYGIYAELDALSSATSREVLQTTCSIDLYGNQVVSVDHSVAIFASGGFNFSNNSQIASADGTSHTVDLIVPSSGTSGGSGCASGIDLSNHTALPSPIVSLLYTPCSVSMVNNTSITGQVIAGSVDLANNFSLDYAPVGPVPGLVLPDPGNPAGSYSVTVVSRYIRTG